MKAIAHFVAKRPLLTLVILTIGACALFGPARVGHYLGSTARGVVSGSVAFVRSL